MKYVSMGYFPEGDRNGEEIWYQPGTRCDFDDRTAKKLEKKGFIKRIRRAMKEPPETREG